MDTNRVDSIACRRLAQAATCQERRVRALALALARLYHHAPAHSPSDPAVFFPETAAPVHPFGYSQGSQVESTARRNSARRGRFSPPSVTPGGQILTPDTAAGGEGGSGNKG